VAIAVMVFQLRVVSEARKMPLGGKFTGSAGADRVGRDKMLTKRTVSDHTECPAKKSLARSRVMCRPWQMMISASKGSRRAIFARSGSRPMDR
jgi:hypothetical protein